MLQEAAVGFVGRKIASVRTKCPDFVTIGTTLFCKCQLLFARRKTCCILG